MRIAGIIPARYDSTRLPGKPLMEVAGKPMIQRVYEQAMKSNYLNVVIVATDDKRIYDAVKNFGGEVVMTSRKHLSGTDRINEASGKIKCDIVVNIQGDEPFIDPKNIDAAIKPLLKGKSLNVSTLAVRMKDRVEIADINKVKVVTDHNGNALYFSRSVIPFSRDIDPLKIKYFKHIGLYVYRKTFLMKFSKMKPSPEEKAEKLEQLRILSAGERIKVVTVKKDSVSIDTKHDLYNVNKKHIKVVLKKIGKEHKPGLIRMLNNPEIERWLSTPPFPYTEKDADDFIAICERASEDFYPFAIETAGRHIGGIGLHIVDEHHGFIGYYLDTSEWGKGYMSEAVRQILELGFERRNLKMIFAYTLDGNFSSEKVLLRAGFIEKHNPKVFIKNGKSLNSKYFEKHKR